ncbi:hypothetical protein [Glycocaulis sp.]|uniref:hypothetical protein n=1 Tax=Glycocaulis sp. TaxID=1969725 RepID=UPI0025C55A1B|nr:hypothetical protein [Glycocaulis sp.]MCH8522298.1 hypothetical protein [Glycocaulis sp.]
MTHQQAFNGDAAIQALRAVLAAIIAAAFIGLVVLLAAVLTAAAFVIAGIGFLGLGAFWVYRKVRGKRQAQSGVLVARRGPDGWTVDGTSTH